MTANELALHHKPGQQTPTHHKIRYTPSDKIRWTDCQVTPSVWFLNTFLTIEVTTPYGTLKYTLKPGYTTDFHSGPSIVNPFIPKIGNIHVAMYWIIHDVNYHGYISRHQADQILRESLIDAGMSKLKSAAVYYATRLAGDGHYSNLKEDQGPLYNAKYQRIHSVRVGWLRSPQTASIHS